jgi:hypothetical protein
MPTKFGSNVDEDHRFEVVVLNGNCSVSDGTSRLPNAAASLSPRTEVASTTYAGPSIVRRDNWVRVARSIGLNEGIPPNSHCILGFDYPGDHPKKRAVTLLAPEEMTRLWEPWGSLNGSRAARSLGGLRGTAWCLRPGWSARCRM